MARPSKTTTAKRGLFAPKTRTRKASSVMKIARHKSLLSPNTATNPIVATSRMPIKLQFAARGRFATAAERLAR